MLSKQSGAQRRFSRGFTIVELLVSIVVMAILATIIVTSINGIGTYSRDNQRKADIAVIAQSLERYYKTNAVATGATYPATTVGSSGIATIVNSTDAVQAPDASTNSVVIATTNAAQTPTISQYVYQPLTLAGGLCTSTPCARFKLYYRLEATNEVITQDSMRQQ